MIKKTAFIFGLLIMLTASAVYAQNQTLKVNVPFNFEAQGKTLLAGEYSLSSRDDQKVSWLIDGKSNKNSKTFVLANTVESVNQGNGKGLSFRKYGDRYFLATITLAGFKIELPQNKEEKMLIQELTAENRSIKAENVTISAVQ